MVKRGLSAEEKKEKLLAIYHGTRQVYNLKEIEKAGSKVGVVQQSIKDINQELVNDGLVDQDKIGSANFYWSFPSKAIVARQNQVESLHAQIETARAREAAGEKRAAELSADRVESQERSAKLRRLEVLRQNNSEMRAELEALKENDPEELKRVQKAIEGVKEGVNRWTANTWAVRDYLVKKRGINGKTADRYLQITADFDEA